MNSNAAANDPAAQSRLYVYAIVRNAPRTPITAPAVADPLGAVWVEPIGGLAALVSNYTGDEIMPVRRNALAHTRVLEAALPDGPMLPMRFGVMVDDVAGLKRVIAPREKDLEMLLDDLSGRVEVGIKARWNEDIIWTEIVAAHPELGRVGNRLKRLSKGEGYYDRIDLGRKVEAAISEKRIAEAEKLQRFLDPFVVRQKQLNQTDDMTYFHTAVLVEGNLEPALFEAITRYESVQPHRLILKVISPVPAYNFVAVSLDWSAGESVRLRESA
ncbi:GvpL/GvpF family gas vesicle protein [Tardiphaga sp.]|uniref:GvpL/GvpF family gas vesicle protein n=1 Tax=Tardiphaga sp. TaxID=1926292 RepID=UPI0019B40A99|nr:GvpL/GvpF family gas vesicle protein [Tardiphaga sp.]MBC7577756.1 GvpL/GvpF family gas vesicle protein [Tardiphaga sp.]